MKRTYKWDDKTQKMIEVTPEETIRVFNVTDDIKAFQSPDGAMIDGRSQWREHLKKTGSVEMGHSDMKSMQTNWNKRQAAFNARLNPKNKYVSPKDIAVSDMPVIDAPERRPSRISQAVANRLHGRPAPDRITLIKIALEESRKR